MTRTGGALVVDCLMALGATKAFGIPGESYLAVLDALHDTQGRLDFVLCRHEGGAAFMASAWGKLTGKPGICLVTRGPGVTNAAIGIHTAMQDSAPMLVLVGQVGTDMIGREAFQEIDYPAVFGSMAKWAVQIDRVDRIPEILARAWKTAVTGRPGPVVIALPEDMLTTPTDIPPLTGPSEIAEPAPLPAALDKALAMLGKARRPLILTGGCTWTAQGKAARNDDVDFVRAHVQRIADLGQAQVQRHQPGRKAGRDRRHRDGRALQRALCRRNHRRIDADRAGGQAGNAHRLQQFRRDGLARLCAKPRHAVGRVVARQRRQVDAAHGVQQPGRLMILLQAAPGGQAGRAAFDGGGIDADIGEPVGPQIGAEIAGHGFLRQPPNPRSWNCAHMRQISASSSNNTMQTMEAAQLRGRSSGPARVSMLTALG